MERGERETQRKSEKKDHYKNWKLKQQHDQTMGGKKEERERGTGRRGHKEKRDIKGRERMMRRQNKGKEKVVKEMQRNETWKGLERVAAWLTRLARVSNKKHGSQRQCSAVWL